MYGLSSTRHRVVSWILRSEVRSSVIKHSIHRRSFTTTSEWPRESELGQYPQRFLYPRAVKPTNSIENFIDQFSNIENGSRCSSEEGTILCGRITSYREASKNLYFYTISDGNTSVQVLADKRHYLHHSDSQLVISQPDQSSLEENEELTGFRQTHKLIQRGDVVAVDGFPGKTKRGEMSIVARQVRLLSPCIADIPSGRGDGKYALKDKHVRYQQRHVDLLANPQGRKVFQLRSKIMDEIRMFFKSRDFLSVETPVLTSSAGGATARPFKTFLNAEHRHLELRIAPELYLKKLVIGGFDRVYELGTVFRNEGLDHTHNPEFTMCEAYQAHADYRDMMDLTQELLAHVSQTVCGSTKIVDPASNIEVDFGKPFKRISIIRGLEEELNLEPGAFPSLSDHSELPVLKKLCLENTNASEDDLKHMNGAKLCDLLVSSLLEPKCIQPTFLTDHPVEMSPLAKASPDSPELTERFELFVLGRELCNAYSELNEPLEQRNRFIHQRDLRAASGIQDHDADAITDEFCDALGYGLPPTAGWGLGVDRLVMLLTGQHSIRDVIFFPVV